MTDQNSGQSFLLNLVAGYQKNIFRLHNVQAAE